MANGTIVPGTARKDDTYAYVSVLVDEGPTAGRVEYSGQTPLVKEDGTPKTNAELKADLIASCKAARDAQVRPIPQGVALSGPVVL